MCHLKKLISHNKNGIMSQSCFQQSKVKIHTKVSPKGVWYRQRCVQPSVSLLYLSQPTSSTLQHNFSNISFQGRLIKLILHQVTSQTSAIQLLNQEILNRRTRNACFVPSKKVVNTDDKINVTSRMTILNFLIDDTKIRISKITRPSSSQI